MTMSKDLFLSILSMDAYNRGYNPGVANLGGAGTGVGWATIAALDLPEGSEPARFYGLAYKLTGSVRTSGNLIASGTTITSYRGKDQPA